MTWSFQIGRVLGIPIRLHLTFLLLLGYLAFVGFRAGDSSRALLALGLFGCVLLHELGHSFAAQRFGVKVLDITLLPIGGVARMAEIPKDPKQELVIAIAGPIVNFVLAPLLFGLQYLIAPPTLNLAGPELGSQAMLLEQLAITNLVMGVFNLIPAFPMDGGRILRALLAMRMPHTRATAVAASVGQLMAFLLAFAGLMFNVWLLLIALFVFLGATDEGNRAQTQEVVAGIPVSAAALTQFETLGRADSVGRAADLLLAGTQQDFPVVEAGSVVGVLTRRRLLEALGQAGRDRYISEVMEPSPEPVSPDSPLDAAVERMVRDGLAMIPVQGPGGLIGLLTLDNVLEFIMVSRATQSAGQHSR